MCNAYLIKNTRATCSSQSSRRDFYCRVILDRCFLGGFLGGFFLNFTCVEVSTPEGLRGPSRHPGAAQKKSCFPAVLSSIPNPGFCCHEMRMRAQGLEHCTELPAGSIWSERGAGWSPPASGGHQRFLSPCFWAGSSLCWWLRCLR